MWGNTQTAGKTSALHSCWPKGVLTNHFTKTDGAEWSFVGSVILQAPKRLQNYTYEDWTSALVWQ